MKRSNCAIRSARSKESACHSGIFEEKCSPFGVDAHNPHTDNSPFREIPQRISHTPRHAQKEEAEQKQSSAEPAAKAMGSRGKTNRTIRTLLLQVDDIIAQDNAAKKEGIEFTAALLDEISEELNKSLESVPEPKTKEEKQAIRAKKKQLKELEKKRNKLHEYDQHLEIMGERNSYSKTDSDATFMHMKEDAMRNGQTKPGYNLQIATENQFITDFALYANRTDTLTLPSFLESFNSRYNRYAKTVVADSGYGSEENYLFMDTHNIEAYVKYNYFHKEQRPRYTPNPLVLQVSIITRNRISTSVRWDST